MTGWEPLRWGAVRVTGLPVTVPEMLVCDGAVRCHRTLEIARANDLRARNALAEAIHASVACGVPNNTSRNRLLRLRRAAVGGRTLPPTRLDDPDLAQLWAAAQETGGHVAAAERTFRAAAEADFRRVRDALYEIAQSRTMQNGLVVSNLRLAALCLRLAEGRAPVTSKKADRDLAALWSYAMRAATRPTPLGAFAICGLLDWHRSPAPTGTAVLGPERRRVSVSLWALAAASERAPDNLTGAPSDLAALPREGGDVTSLVRDLERFSDAPPGARLATIVALETRIGGEGEGGTLVYEDILLDSASGPRPPCTPKVALDVLWPVLRLAESALTILPHLRMCEAFFGAFGVDGVCDDVPAFLARLESAPGFVDRLRFASLPPAWLASPIRSAAERANIEEVLCPLDWFDALPRWKDACDLAVYFSFSGGRAVLGGVQSGRGKYLSRFLRSGDPRDAAPLFGLRAELATGEALPVEIDATFGLNFQLHPPIARYAFAGLRRDAVDLVRLEDLRLIFDPKVRRLQLQSRILSCEIEPVHLGFLRDAALPSTWLLLRALSPRMADDTVSERLRIHDTLDQMALNSGETLPLRRPRLVVGNLVLEPARWLFPVRSLPQLSDGQGAEGHLSEVLDWLAATGAPAACWLEVVGPSGRVAAPRSFHWCSPWAGRILRSALRPYGSETQYLSVVLKERLALDGGVNDATGAMRAAEWMLQVRRRQNHDSEVRA